MLCGSSSGSASDFGAGAALLRFLPVFAGCLPSSCASALGVCFGVCFFKAAFVLDLPFRVTGVAGGLDNCCF